MYNGSNDSFNFKPHELTLVIPFGITMASLGNSIIKRANKKTSRQNCRDANSILNWRPYCRYGLTTRNCQLACASFNYFHNHLTLLKGIMYFNPKRCFVKNFFLIHGYLINPSTPSGFSPGFVVRQAHHPSSHPERSRRALGLILRRHIKCRRMH